MQSEMKNALFEKLNEMKSEFAESDMLVDFVGVMLENNKPKEYIMKQLMDLTSAEDSQIITDWIFNYLQNNRIGSYDSNQENFDDEIKSRRRERRRSYSPERRYERRRSYDRGDRYDRDRYDHRDRSGRRMRHAPYKREKKELSTPKCTFFPNCTREGCKFFHPTEPCPDGAACTKGPACRFIHQIAPPTACKFKANCINPNCTFAHPSPAVLSLSTVQCKFYPNCLNSFCTFYHPEVTQQSEENIEKAAPTVPDVSAIPCKYDAYCKRPDCHFFHPSRAKTSRNKVLIVNHSNNTSDRIYALPEQDVEHVVMDVDS
ncbi:hypothetical protein HDV06_006461 [Boothiomyces sp. JEL0866]|nr:hypothetical protein HDV06_001242 [Boothiomyces sp. JEL0866]KAJ3324568.1 hypothetical protein HDV06_006461 [Boothiomyces sp. JEL0866]